MFCEMSCMQCQNQNDQEGICLKSPVHASVLLDHVHRLVADVLVARALSSVLWHTLTLSHVDDHDVTLINREDLLVVLPSSVSYITAEYLCSSPLPSQPTGLWLWPARCKVETWRHIMTITTKMAMILLLHIVDNPKSGQSRVASQIKNYLKH